MCLTARVLRQRLHDSQLSGAALTVLLCESQNVEAGIQLLRPSFEGQYKFVFDSNGEATSITYSPTPMNMERHFDGANYAFADGHVKWLKHTSISRGYAGRRPQSEGWSQPHPKPMGNAMPPSQLTAPYTATFSPIDYF